VDVFDRSAKRDERGIEELGYAALRGGDVAGEHTVFFFGESERVELTHRATSRDIFARGALRAASFIHTQEPGLYGMQDVLGAQA
jgi:4-hydroxy-tetrahydrodipicolinate reductase